MSNANSPEAFIEVMIQIELLEFTALIKVLRMAALIELIGWMIEQVELHDMIELIKLNSFSNVGAAAQWSLLSWSWCE